MTTESLLSRTPTPGVSAARAMSRMWRYTTASMFLLVILYGVIAISPVENRYLLIASAVALLPTAVLVWYWDRPAPAGLGISAVIAGTGIWWATIIIGDVATTALVVSVPIGILLSQPMRWSWWMTLAGLLFVLAPVVVYAVVQPDGRWAYLATAATVGYVVSIVVFGLNRYAWNRYLELDAARQTGEKLAIAQERFRFAADLHDIQGHTLHVLRLKTQLVDRLLDTDPAAAHVHLAEAQALITETLANTRSLAFGDRLVAVASELANATQLFDAAGIVCETQGELDPGENEELFALLIREATTNILRHAQSTRVTVTLSSGRVRITNNGSPSRPRALSGLSRLAERFAAVGGTLTTTVRGDVFTTEAVIAR